MRYVKFWKESNLDFIFTQKMICLEIVASVDGIYFWLENKKKKKKKRVFCYVWHLMTGMSLSPCFSVVHLWHLADLKWWNCGFQMATDNSYVSLCYLPLVFLYSYVSHCYLPLVFCLLLGHCDWITLTWSW
jgi:hypothetical protein